MILITAALMCEAKPIIAFMNLKRVQDETKWELYGNGEDVALLITGVGPVAAAASVSAVMTKYGFTGRDFILNIGTCCAPEASEDDFGRIYLINKLTDGETGRDFYPDMLIAGKLEENALVSVARPVYRNMPDDEKERTGDGSMNAMQESGPKNSLFDMEAAFIYQTAKYYLGPSKMAFLKIVSDNGLRDSRNSFAELGKRIENYVGQQEKAIREFIDAVRKACGNSVFEAKPSVDKNQPVGNNQQNEIIRPGKSEMPEKLAADLRATKSMENMLNQLIKYAAAAGTDYCSIVDKMYAEGLLPVSNKKAGMDVLKQLEKAILKG